LWTGDKVWVYAFDAALGNLGAEPSSLDLPCGAGPRHCDFSPDGKFIYITCELDGNVRHDGPFDPSKNAAQIEINGRLWI
jgi:6-phosphogluconolactonase (cycloisomerase 2 family)